MWAEIELGRGVKMIFEKIRERLITDKRIGRTSLEAFCEILKDAEAEYNNGWIPCSERLPENISTVLVQVKGIEKPTIGWYGNMDNKWILSERDFADLQEFTVLAWQPLPEPYKKGE